MRKQTECFSQFFLCICLIIRRNIVSIDSIWVFLRENADLLTAASQLPFTHFMRFYRFDARKPLGEKSVIAPEFSCSPSVFRLPWTGSIGAVIYNLYAQRCEFASRITDE